MAQVHMSVTEPATDSPVLVEVPHAGLWLDPETAVYTRIPARAIPHDADLYVDDLFANAPGAGATLLCSHVSRYVIDLNTELRELTDERGNVWRRSHSGDSVSEERLPRSEQERVRARYYQPYHEMLARLLERKKARFGFVLLVCAHSFPPPRGGAEVADFVIGTCGGTTCDARWSDIVAEAGAREGWSIAHDDPFPGGYSTQRHGKPDKQCHALQLELLRSLYMDTLTLARGEAFDDVSRFASELVEALVCEAKRG